MKIKKGDNVIVLAGKSKGTKGKVLSVNKITNRVVVEGAAKIKKQIKARSKNEKGSIVEIEGTINASNVMLIDPKTNKPTRIGKKMIDGKMVRISKKSGQEIA